MEYALPSGVVNTDSAYFYADSTLLFGPLVKELGDQTLIIIDYSQLNPPHVIGGYDFALDVTSNPAMVVSYPHVNAAKDVLTFLLSGGIVGQQYRLTIRTTIDINQRLDVLTINIPSSSGDCVSINPVPQIYTQLPLGDPTQGYVNTGVRYFWGSAPPTNPNVMDQWYSPDTGMLSEWMTDGTIYRWQVLMDEGLVEEAPFDSIAYSRFNGVWLAAPIQLDAPVDGTMWARQNNIWVRVPAIITDAPNNGTRYGRYNGIWQADAIQFDAPNDANLYGRNRNAWVALTPIIPDAPQNGTLYSRVNSNWLPTPVQADAPNDGQFYARNNRSWIAILVDQFLTDGPSDGTLYGRQDGAWVAAYPAGNPANYVSLAQMTAALLPFALLSGARPFTGAVQFNAGLLLPNGPSTLAIAGGQPGQTLVAASTQSTLAWAPPPIPEPPNDGVTYARGNGVWVPTASGAGVSEAPSDGTTYARKSAAWTHLTHTDITDWSATLTTLLAPYALQANVPPGSSSFPLMDGANAIGTASAWARADHVHPTDTSRYAATNPAGYQTAAQVTAALLPYALITSLPVASNASPQMDGTVAPGGSAAYSRGDHVHPTDTSRLALSGGIMSGLLTLSGDPNVALNAATKQYVDNAIATLKAYVDNAIANAIIDCGTY